MSLLAAAGHHVTLVCATSGGQSSGPRSELADIRIEETHKAATELGVATTLFLGYDDSGLLGEVKSGFAHVRVSEAAETLAQALEGQHRPVDALITYDSDGIYGHPDHVQVHHVGILAAQLVGIGCVYEATVDREYLHFVETHLVVEAGLEERPQSYGLSSTHIGRSTLEITTVIDVASELATKKRAMAAHRSQLPADAAVFALNEGNFAAVYGQEWYVRRGPIGPLESL